MPKVDTTKYSNLTEAIGNGKPIDFMGLDKRNAVLVNGRGQIAYHVILDRVLGEYRPDTAKAWRMWDKGYVSSVTVSDVDAFCYWNGKAGSSVWVYGDIPVIPEKSPRLVDFRSTINGEPTDEDIKRLDGKTAYLSHQDHGNLAVKLVYKNQTSGITVDVSEGRYPLQIILTYAFTNSKGWKLLVEENHDQP